MAQGFLPAASARSLAALLACALLAAWPRAAGAQALSNRPIKIILGPSPDVFVRVVAQQLQENLGQSVVIEPRPGAGGKIAVSSVATAEPDGHTLLFATPTYTLSTAMQTATYDIVKELEPVSMFGLIAYVLVVSPEVPAKSVTELVALAKARPGGLNCASAGIGTVPHIACEVMNKSAGIDLVHVPYRDVNSAMTGVVGGHVQMFFGVSATAKPQVESGSVRGLAVTAAKRSALMPAIPTMVESGFADFVMPGWGGLMAPAGTPKEIVARLNAEVARAVANPDVSKRLATLGMEAAAPSSPAEVGGFIKADIARWTSFVQVVGLDKLKEPAAR